MDSWGKGTAAKKEKRGEIQEKKKRRKGEKHKGEGGWVWGSKSRKRLKRRDWEREQRRWDWERNGERFDNRREGLFFEQ